MSDETYYMRGKLERVEEWRDWVQRIPAFAIPKGCKVRIIPPFAGAMGRAIIEDENGEQAVSVYFDVLDNLGFMGEPYFEIMPGLDKDGHPSRFLMNEIAELEAAIERVVTEKIKYQ